jgi:hypothetical protein
MSLLSLAYIALTLITTVDVMLNRSFAIGAAALVSCALCFFGVATFVGSFLARHEKEYGLKDLIGIGAIATILVVAGFALMFWSGFRIIYSGYVIEGPYWLLVGIVTALLITRKKHAL